MVRLSIGHSTQDGAFIAMLIDSVTIHLHDVWWIHHGRNDDTYPLFDARRNWDCGLVTEVMEDHFSVEVLRGNGEQASLAAAWLYLFIPYSWCGVGRMCFEFPTYEAFVC